MRDGQGREVLVRLELPLPLALVSTLTHAIEKAAKKHGYTGVAMLLDGSSRIVATPPGEPRPAKPGEAT